MSAYKFEWLNFAIFWYYTFIHVIDYHRFPMIGPIKNAICIQDIVVVIYRR